MPGGRPKDTRRAADGKKVLSIRSNVKRSWRRKASLRSTTLMMLVRAETPPGLDPAVAKAREELRFEAAKAAAPYVHARLQTTTLAGDPEKPQHKVLIEFVKAGGQVEVSQPARALREANHNASQDTVSSRAED